ncbi:MAG: chemotaxis protein CheA [Actinomycetota bacterium]|nr:chemotaxis protein CheA [Actinomycetota bacterium]
MTLDPETEEIMAEFMVESIENLDRLDDDLLRLEQDPTDRNSLNSAFRSLHTIKGTAGFVGLPNIERVSHAGESLLSRLRDEGAALSSEGAGALLSTVDALRSMMSSVQSAGNDGDDDHQALVDNLLALAEQAHVQASGQATRSGAIGAGDPEAAVPDASTNEAAVPDAAVPEAAVPGDMATDLSWSAGTEPATAPQATQAPPASTAAAPKTTEPATASKGAGEAPAAAEHTEARPESSVRVDVGLLDRLMNLVGELVLARNQLLQVVGAESDQELSLACQRLSLITTELQESVMKTRMQPIGNVWAKFPRVVRDLARSCGKQVRLEMEGQETELDRTIIESIKDPLTHLVRNAVDHGIEDAATRRAAGKPDEGVLSLRAYHEGGYVTIEVAEDGAGIDPERVRQRAVERGLVTADQAARMNDRELTAMIFLPGFSTAKTVSSVSGRGVGMDVVKTHVERIGGSVDVTSALGVGTSFHLKIPLTLAIVPALIVTSDGERYAIPQVSLLELVRLDGDRALEALESVGDAPVFRRRGKLLPLVFLRHELGSAQLFDGDGSLNVVVLQVEDQAFGLVVDAVNDSEEIVVKPLRGQLKDVPVFAGATIMGDGRVALILDVAGIARRSEATGEGKRPAADDSARLNVDSLRQTLLVLATGERGRVAVSLEQVSRLEEFDISKIESAGNRDVVQYRGHLLPLIHLSDAMGIPRSMTEEDLVAVVVVQVGEREVGVAVDGILDIVEQDVVFEEQLGRDGILGSAVVAGRATEVVELEALVRNADPSLFEMEEVLS